MTATDARPVPSARVVVLVEGPSDAAVVSILAAARGLDEQHVRVVSMGGVTNVGRHLPSSDDCGTTAVTGLCDASEVGVVVRALRRRGHAVAGPEDLERLGFYVCVRDLEDELVRALGVPAVESVLRGSGQLAGFRSFQNQPQWRQRDPVDQLRRFAGAGSGRKLSIATGLAQRLGPDTTPGPLARLVDRVTELTGEPRHRSGGEG